MIWLDFLLLFLLAFGLWWLAGRLIDDVFAQMDREYESWLRERDRKDRAA